MKFIHAADIHLDSPLEGLSSYRNAPVDTVRGATREAFVRLVDLAIEENVDFMILAGDLYDGPWRDMNTGQFFCAEMGRLRKNAIPVYILYGNHDAESEMTKKLMLPDNVHVFDHKRPQTHLIEQLKVALHGQSFKDKATFDNLASGYPSPIPGWLNIGVLHTGLEGDSAHAHYAPCSLTELVAKGYQYWALGHIHQHAILHESPWVVFPGNLQGRQIKETGNKGAMIVEASDGEIVRVERMLVDVVRWHKAEIDCRGSEDLQQVVLAVSDELQRIGNETSTGCYACVRIVLIGKSPAHGALFGLEAQLREEILAQIAAHGLERIWVEKVKIETQANLESASLAGRADAIADLQKLLLEAPVDEDLKTSLLCDLKSLVAHAPLAVVEDVPMLNALRQGQADEVIREVSPNLISYLAQAD